MDNSRYDKSSCDKEWIKVVMIKVDFQMLLPCANEISDSISAYRLCTSIYWFTVSTISIFLREVNEIRSKISNNGIKIS